MANGAGMRQRIFNSNAESPVLPARALELRYGTFPSAKPSAPRFDARFERSVS